MLWTCKKGDPIIDDPVVEDPIIEDTNAITTNDLPLINAATHRLIGLDYSRSTNSAWVTNSYYEYDDDGRCTAYGSHSSEVVLEYWDDSDYELTWDGQNIVGVYYESSSDLDWYEETWDYSYTTEGNQKKLSKYETETGNLVNVTRWLESELTILRSVDYHYDWQIGLYDSTITNYEDNGNNEYSRYTVKQNDTSLVRTENYDAEGRLVSITYTNGSVRAKRYYEGLKNPFPITSTIPSYYRRQNSGMDEYGVFLNYETEKPPKVFANGDLPQLKVNQKGDTVYFRYEAL